MESEPTAKIRGRVITVFPLMKRPKSSQQINLGLNKPAVKIEAEILRETKKPLVRSDLVYLGDRYSRMRFWHHSSGVGLMQEIYF